ncbi:MAG: DoxX family membrane protein [Candidatus Angelobacter sp.]
MHWALQHPYISGYGTGIVELLIGLSMVVGFRVRIFSIIGALYMLNLTFATWNLPAGTPAWRYIGNELDHIPLLLLFLVFLAHNAGKTWGLDGART